jgi:hypothetical protein
VQFILNEDVPVLKAQRIMKDIKAALDFFLSGKDESNPWRYAMYYCATASFAYSTVWCVYFPGQPVN